MSQDYNIKPNFHLCATVMKVFLTWKFSLTWERLFSVITIVTNTYWASLSTPNCWSLFHDPPCTHPFDPHNLWGRYYYYYHYHPQFTKEETEAQRLNSPMGYSKLMIEPGLEPSRQIQIPNSETLSNAESKDGRSLPQPWLLWVQRTIRLKRPNSLSPNAKLT